MSESQGPDVRSAAHRAALRDFAGALALALSVSLLLIAAQALGMRPLVAVEAVDEQIVQLLARPLRAASVRDGSSIRRIVLVDIDDDTMRQYVEGAADDRWAKSWSAGRSTPRALTARLLQVVRTSRATVIFLDFDLREPQSGSGDQLLLAELNADVDRVEARRPPVLVPRLLATGHGSICSPGGSTPARSGVGVRTIVDDAAGAGPVYFVHPYVETNALGFASGICSAVQLSNGVSGGPRTVTAAAAAALQLSRSPTTTAAPPQGLIEPFQRIQFRFNQESEYSVTDRTGLTTKVFQHLPAHRLLLQGTDLSILRDAIVILGASHLGAEEPMATALGPMPGALVHANAILQMQIGEVVEASHVLEFVIELVCAIVLSAVYAWLIGYRGELVRASGASRWRQRMSHVLRFVFTAFLSLFIAAFYFAIVVPNFVLPGSSQFAVLVPILVVGAEFAFEALKIAQRLVEHSPMWGGPSHESGEGAT